MTAAHHPIARDSKEEKEKALKAKGKDTWKGKGDQKGKKGEQPTGKGPNICYYYNQAGGCRKGKDCPYKHEKVADPSKLKPPWPVKTNVMGIFEVRVRVQFMSAPQVIHP